MGTFETDATACRDAHDYAVEIEAWDADADIELVITCERCDVQATKIVRWEEITTWSLGGGLDPFRIEGPYPEEVAAPPDAAEDAADG